MGQYRAVPAVGASAGRFTAGSAAAAAVLSPFVGRAVRALAWSPHGRLAGDEALMDLQVRQAMHWQLELGVYDRFGWHHPGPVYLYLISFIERLTGEARAAQAQIVTASLLDGLAAAGVVLVVRRAYGTRPAVAGGAAVAVACALMGGPVLGDPWGPHVVIVPLVFMGALCAAALRGSVACLLGAALVGSAVVQTDVGTLPLAGVWLAVATIGAGWRRMRGEGPKMRWVAVGGLAVAIAVVWLPVVVQQATGRPGNLTVIERFFAAHHGWLGLTYSLYLVGAAGGAVFGWAPPPFSIHVYPGVVRFAVIASSAVGLALLAVRLRSRSADAAAIALSGIGASVLAAGRIVGMPWEYLLAWAAAPVVLLLVAAAVLVAERAAPVDRRRAGGLIAAGSLAGFVTVAAIQPLPTGVVSADVTMAAAVAVASANGGPVGLASYDLLSANVEAGVADQLVARAVPFAVAPGVRWTFPYSCSSQPARWEALTGTGEPVPPGYTRVLATADLVVSVGDRSPPGW